MRFAKRRLAAVELRPEQESKMMMRDVGMWWCSPKRVASFIGVRAYENTEHTIVSRVAAVLYAPNRMVLPDSIMVEGPAGTPVHVMKTCTMIFPLPTG